MKFIKTITKSLFKLKTFIFSITNLFLIKSVVYAGDIFSGTQNLFSDVKTKVMIIAPFVAGGVVALKLLVMQFHDQQEQIQDKKAIKWAFIILVAIECIGGLITWFTSFYSG